MLGAGGLGLDVRPCSKVSVMGAAASGITADKVRRLPKAELHLHLDSGFEVEDAVRLADENGVPLLKEPPEAMFEWDDLQDFLRSG